MNTSGTMMPILMYHEVASPPETSSRLAVSEAAFKTQLAHLSATGFTTFTMSALASALQGGTSELPNRPIALTFDDGYADFHGVVLPMLQQYGFTATLFVTTGWVADADSPAGRRSTQMLTWAQIREAANFGIEIGAHSHSHPQLDQLPIRQLRLELDNSKSLLEDQLGKEIPGLAYPFGYSNARVRRAVRVAGYKYACAVGNMVATPTGDLFTLPRLTVKRGTQLRTFEQIVRMQHIPLVFAKEHALARGWAMVRHARRAVSGVPFGR